MTENTSMRFPTMHLLVVILIGLCAAFWCATIVVGSWVMVLVAIGFTVATVQTNDAYAALLRDAEEADILSERYA